MAKIIGNTTATPNPRPDWSQTDSTKADFIKNKPVVDQEYSAESTNAQSGTAVAEGVAEAKLYTDEQILNISDGFGNVISEMYGSDLTEEGAPTIRAIAADEANKALESSKDYTDENIPTVNNATLTIQKNGTNVATFTANSSTNATANITVPTGAAADKGVDTSISAESTSANLPTSKAVAAFVEGKGYKTTDNNTTYTFATGEGNGQIKVIPSVGTAQNVSVKGLGTAAYTASTAYATAAQGAKADAAVPNTRTINGKELSSNVEINIIDIDNLQKALDERADKSQGIFYIEGDSNSTTDTTNKVATWIGSHDEITEYFSGLTILYKVVTAGSTTTTLNINGLGAVAVVRNATTGISTACPVDGVLLLTYTVDSSGTAYWKTADYDANTKNTAGTSNKTGTKLFLVGGASQSSSGVTTYTNSNIYVTTGNVLYSANGFSGQLTGNADTATKATQDASGNVITSTYETKANATEKLNEVNDQISQLSSEIADFDSDLEAEVANQLDGTKADIVSELLAQIGGMPVFGTIDDDKRITMTSMLADGVYSLGYDVNGAYTEIVSFTIGNGDVVVPTYTNLNNPAIASGTITDWTIATGGWLKDVRYSASSSALKTASGLWISNFVDIPEGAKTLRVKGLNVNKANTAIIYIVDGAYKYQMAELATAMVSKFTTLTEDYFEIEIETLSTWLKAQLSSSTTFNQLRFTGSPVTSVEDVIITLDEEIA